MADKNFTDEYPTLTKMNAVKPHSQILGEFIDWLATEKKMFIGEYVEDPDTERVLFMTANINTEKILAEFFGIDLVEAEKERQRILDNIRKENKHGK